VDGEVLPEGVGDPARLGELLRVLRELPVTSELAAALGGMRPGGARPPWAEVLTDEVLPLLPERWRAEGAERIAEALALPPVTPTLVHGDLGGGNLLWGRDGRLAGVIDWDLAALFDPALDAALLAWHGWDNIRRGVDAETYRRAGVWERLFGVGHVAAVLNGRTAPWYPDRYAGSIARWLDENGGWRAPGSGS
jgi:aminoglycoside phosphotransferase (APT) family kinase protein